MGQLIAKKKKTPLDRYHEGSLTAEQFLDKLFNSREADRNRRNLEEKHKKSFLSNPLRKAR